METTIPLKLSKERPTKRSVTQQEDTKNDSEQNSSWAYFSGSINRRDNRRIQQK